MSWGLENGHGAQALGSPVATMSAPHKTIQVAHLLGCTFQIMIYHAVNMSLSFGGLPSGVLSSVFPLLHDEDHAFIALRSTCRKHRRLSEPLLLRSIVLTGVHGCEHVLLKRMWSAEEGIADHVQCIRIVPFESKPLIAKNIAAMLEPCWNLLTNLKDIIWESALPIPRYLLNLISSKSTLRLHYLNTSRHHYALDKPLLSHPNLHTLKFTAFTMGSPAHSRPTELAQLKTCLIQARKLEVLHLNLHDDQNRFMTDFQNGELNLQFVPGDTFPPLHELVLDPMLHNYQLSPEHCGAWMNCMSWSQLHTLDFGNGSPTHLLSALIGRVPQLKDLTFGFCFDSDAAPMWRCDDLTIVEDFILAIDALRSVRMATYDDDQMRKIRSSLFNKHGESLRTVCAELDIRDAWELEDFVHLAEKLPNVQNLTTTLSVVETDDGKKSRWPGDGGEVSSTGKGPFHLQTPPIPQSRPVHTTTPQFQRPRSGRFGKLKSLFTSSSSSHTPRTEKPASLSKRSSSTSSAATTLLPPRNIHNTLTSMHSLRNLKLHILLRNDTYDLIVDTRYPVYPIPSLLDQTKATKLMLRLWNDFGPGSSIVGINVVFHSPGNSNKTWTYTAAKKWREGKREIGIDVEEEGQDFDVFDPFGK